MSVTPPTVAQRTTASLIIGTASPLQWMLWLLGAVDLLLLHVDAQNDPSLGNIIQIPIDLFIMGFIFRLALIVYVVLAGGGGAKTLMDVDLDLADISAFAMTAMLAFVAAVMVNVVSPTVYGKVFGNVLPVVGLIAFNFVRKPKGGKQFKKDGLRSRRVALVAVIGLLLVSGSAARVYASSGTTTPVGHGIQLSVSPNTPKLEGLLIGISEEQFFRGAILPTIAVLGVVLGAPLPVALVVAVITDEVLFTAFHSFVYSDSGLSLFVVFFSGVTFSLAYLSALFFNRPARLDALQIVHGFWDYLSF